MAVDTKVERPVAVEVTEDGTNSVVHPGDVANKAIRSTTVVDGPILTKRFGPVTLGSPVIVSASGVTVVYTPAAGKSIRLKYLALSSPPENSATTLVTVILGGINIYSWYMGAPGGWAHSFVREGPVDGTLALNLSSGQSVAVNMDLEEF